MALVSIESHVKKNELVVEIKLNSNFCPENHAQNDDLIFMMIQAFFMAKLAVLLTDRTL